MLSNLIEIFGLWLIFQVKLVLMSWRALSWGKWYE